MSGATLTTIATLPGAHVRKNLTSKPKPVDPEPERLDVVSHQVNVETRSISTTLRSLLLANPCTVKERPREQLAFCILHCKLPVLQGNPLNYFKQ